MSETVAPATLPLFFNGVVGVSAGQHSHLRINREAGYGFAAKAQAIPIGLGEIEVACQHYPIVFTAGPAATPMVLLGLREANNQFVLADGSWRPDSYVPAYCRAYPFLFVEDREKQVTFVAMDPGASSLSATEGALMFEDGNPSPALNETIAFCAAFRDSLNDGNAFGAALQAAGLLEEEEATITFTAGGTARVTGFRLLKADRLDGIEDATFLDWRRKGWIKAIYAHLHSAGRWGRLVELISK